MKFVVQEECTINPPQEVKDLGQTTRALMSSLPLRSTHPLAEPMYKRLQVPMPGKETDTGTADPMSGAPAAARLGEEPSTDELLPPTPPKENKVNVGVVVGPIVAAAVLVLVGVLAAVFVRRHRRKQRIRKEVANGSVQHQVC